MRKTTLRPVAVATAIMTSWTALASAQQQPGTNAPTPLPASESASSVSNAPILQEPVIDMTTERSSLPNAPLLVTGLVILGGSYGVSAGAAALSDTDRDDKLYYPVVGPWMTLNDRNCNVDPCDNKTLDTTLLIGSGVLQGLGALSVVMSLFIPTKSTHDWYLIGNKDVLVTPMLGYGELGAAAVGRF
jgi:hypothetical protein